MLKTFAALLAAGVIALAAIPDTAQARGGFGGGGFRGGGAHFGGGGFRGGFGGWRGGGFRRFGPGIGLGLGLGYGLGYPYYYGGYGPYAYNGCIRSHRVWTAYGWRIVPVNVCRAYGYGYY
jgi:hypothetical protein